MKKLIYFGLAILVLLLFSGCEETKETTEPTITTPIEPPRDETWFESQCKEECKEDTGCFNSCMNKNAAIEQDPSLCEVITANLLKERCKDNVLMRKAISTNDINFCKQMIDENIKQACNNKLKS